MNDVTIPAGTLVKVEGLPFELIADTPVRGTAINLEIALGDKDGITDTADYSKSDEYLAVSENV